MQIPKFSAVRMSAPPPKTARPITTARPRNLKEPFQIQRKIQRQDNEFNSPETLLQEKNDLMNEIRYLQNEIKRSRIEMNSVNEEIAQNAQRNLAFQERFADKSVSDAAKRRYFAETQLLKLQEIFEQTENKYQQVWTLFSPEQDFKMKAEYSMQKQKLKVLNHEISDLEEKQNEVNDELNSEELQQRIDKMRSLTSQYSALKEELKKEKQRQNELVEKLHKTKQLSPTPVSQMQAEINRLMHQLNTLDRVSVIYEKKQNKESKFFPTQPTTPHRINPRKKQQRKIAKTSQTPHRKEQEMHEVLPQHEKEPEPIGQKEESHEVLPQHEKEPEQIGQKEEIEEKEEQNENNETKSSDFSDSFDDDSDHSKHEEEQKEEDVVAKKSDFSDSFEDDFTQNEEEEKKEEEDSEIDFENNLFNITQNRKFERE